MEEVLGRLSKRSGVRATLVLDRSTGAVLKTSGQLPLLRSSSRPKNSTLSSLPAASFPGDAVAPQNGEADADSDAVAAEFAQLVWAFIKASGTLVDELDEEVRYTIF